MKVGLFCAALGAALALVGVARGVVPLNPTSVSLALVLSAGAWGLVSWAVATAAWDVESDDDEEGDQASP